MPTWFPGARFKRDALNVRGDVQKMLCTPFEMVKNNLVCAIRNLAIFLRGFDDSMKDLGIGVRSFTSNLLEKLDPEAESKNNSQDEEDVKGIAGVLYGGGSLMYNLSPLQSSNSVAIF